MNRDFVKCILITSMVVLSLTGCQGAVSTNKGTADVSTQVLNQEKTTHSIPTAEESDTVKWINGTFAVLTVRNGEDTNLFGASNKNEVNKKVHRNALKEWWDITDRASLDETIESLSNKECHSGQFREEMAMLKEEGFFDIPEEEIETKLLEKFDITKEQAASIRCCIVFFKNHQECGIDAWDYNRAMSLIAWGYIADYYTFDEAFDKSIEIGNKIQKEFNSWDELMESYIYGYAYWAEEDIEDSGSETRKRQKVYEELKTQKDSLYDVDFNLTLKKDW